MSKISEFLIIMASINLYVIIQILNNDYVSVKKSKVTHYMALRIIYQNALESVMKFKIYEWIGDQRRIVLLVTVALGLSFRLIHFDTLADTAFLRLPLIYTQSDMYAFWEWSQQILKGDLLGKNTYHFYYKWMGEIASEETWYRWWGGKEIFQQAPFYPYWLASTLSLSDGSIEFVIFIQLVLGTPSTSHVLSGTTCFQ